MTLKMVWFTALVLSSAVLSGCGAAASAAPTSAPSGTSRSTAPTQPPTTKALAQVPLVRKVSVNLNKGQLTAHMPVAQGTPLASQPLSLTAALHDPTTHYGTLKGPGWTLVFGVEPPKAAAILVNGHRAVATPTPATMKPGYVVWEYFLSGQVNRPVVQFASHS